MNGIIKGAQPMFHETSLLWVWLVRASPILAPPIGLGSILSLLFLDSQSQEAPPWVEFWRIGLTLIIGVFVTLCGVIYRDMNRRITDTTKTQKDNHEFIQKILADIDSRQERMIGVMLTIAVSAGGGGSTNKTDLLETVKMLMSK